MSKAKQETQPAPPAPAQASLGDILAPVRAYIAASEARDLDVHVQKLAALEVLDSLMLAEETDPQ
jgi:hypothetical protein